MTRKQNEPFELMGEAEILTRERKNKRWTQEATLQPSDSRTMITRRDWVDKVEEAKSPQAPDLSNNLFNNHNKKMGYEINLDHLRSLYAQFITTRDILHYELNGEAINVKVPAKFNPNITFAELGGINGKIDFYRGVRGYTPHPDEFKFHQKSNAFVRRKCQIEINPSGNKLLHFTRLKDWGKAVEYHCKKYLDLHSSISFYKDISIIGELNG